MHTLNDLKKLNRNIHIKLALLLILFFTSMLLHLLGIGLVFFLFQMILLLYVVINFSHLYGLKRAIEQANKLNLLYQHEVISEGTFEEIMNDIFHRQDYVFDFKKTHDIDKLKQIKAIENKKYQALKNEEEIQSGIRISKKLISRYLDNFFQDRPPFFSGKSYFYKINLKILKRSGTKYEGESDNV
jgi:hypothetical protein